MHCKCTFLCFLSVYRYCISGTFDSFGSPLYFNTSLQDAMPSPVTGLRGPNIKHHDASFLEDYTFQPATPYINALRDPVCNRVTLVGFLCLT